MWHCTQWWPSLCPIYVCTLPREQNTRRGWGKNDKAAGELCFGYSPCNYRSQSPKRQRETRERERERGGGGWGYTPTRHIQKLWVCMFWMLKFENEKDIFHDAGCLLCFLSPTAAAQQTWGLWAAQSSCGPTQKCYKARYLCSLAPGSTDYQGRDQDQVQLLGQ